MVVTAIPPSSQWCSPGWKRTSYRFEDHDLETRCRRFSRTHFELKVVNNNDAGRNCHIRMRVVAKDGDGTEYQSGDPQVKAKIQGG